MYLTYEEYQEYGGTLDATTFNDYEFEAEALINYVTFNRLKNDTVIPDDVKRLVKYLVDLAQKKAEALSLGGTTAKAESDGTAIKSQSNDGVSITYNSMSSYELFKACETDALAAIDKYLNGVMNELGRKLLYRGLYPGE